MSIVNSSQKPRLLLPFFLAVALAALPLPATGFAWLDEVGTKAAFADDDDDDDRYDDDRYDDDRYDDDDDDDDCYGDDDDDDCDDD